MKQTPIHDRFNAVLLAILPRNATRIVEIGCSSGALAREYARLNPHCDYIGIEIDPQYAEVARAHCSRVLVGSIESMPNDILASLLPADCWVFGDVLEHLRDPWSVLRRIREASPSGTIIAACVPNAQHWSVQIRLNSGEFRYEDAGLLDRTHIRWFTRTTVTDLFHSSGFETVEIGARVIVEPSRETMMRGVRAMAEATGTDRDASTDAVPFQWLVRASGEAGRIIVPAVAEAGRRQHDVAHDAVIALIPDDSARIVEVGCGRGATAREYRKLNASCEYVGIESTESDVEAARRHCTSVLDCDIEQASDEVFQSLFPSSCWLFDGALERLYDPWSLLRRIRENLSDEDCVIACVHNAQHWSTQLRLNCGELWYDSSPALDRSHLRWFTKRTLTELFASTGFEIVEGGGLVTDETPGQQAGLEAVKALAAATGIDVEDAVANAVPIRWLVRAKRASEEPFA